jgi:hypothetical protein
MTADVARKGIQTILQTQEDGVIGPATLAALTHLSGLAAESAWPAVATDAAGAHAVTASTFADPADVAAFRACKAAGGTDSYCFGKGDNGIGKWGDDTSEGSGPACALPPEDWAQFGDAARNKPVMVTAQGKEVTCFLRDTMPHVANIHNGCGIDLNPDACAALGITPPATVPVTWAWG